MQMMVRSFIPGYSMVIVSYDSNLKIINAQTVATDANVSTTVYLFSGTVAFISIRLAKNPSATITPSEATAAQIGVSDNSIYTKLSKAGTQYIYGTIAPNTGGARSGNIVLKSKAGATTYTLPINQAGASGNTTATPSTIAAGYVHIPVTVALTVFGAWSVTDRDTWITPSVNAGGNGTTNVTLTIADNTANEPRTGTITFYNDLTGEIAVVTVNQAGAPQTIGATPFRVTAPKTSGTVRGVVLASQNNWAMSEKPSWVTVAPTSGAGGGGTISITYTANSTGVKRSGYLKIRNTTTNEIAICIIEQEG